MTDLLGGAVDMVFDAYPSMLPFIVNGDARVLAIGSAKRPSFLPQYPTVQESGVPDFDSSSWWGLLAPAKTPMPIVEKINGVLIKAFNEKANREKLIKIGLEPTPEGPKEFAKLLKDKYEEYGRVVKAADIKAQ
jgi:tripartite-type tricarboxylate transporter receptor subunit TctC